MENHLLLKFMHDLFVNVFPINYLKIIYVNHFTIAILGHIIAFSFVLIYLTEWLILLTPLNVDRLKLYK